MLNPNWRVVLDDQALPEILGEDGESSIVDDCGLYAAQAAIREAGLDLRAAEAMCSPLHSVVVDQRRRVKVMKVGALPLQDALQLVLNKKSLAYAFFAVRRWQLLPPWPVASERFENHRRARFEAELRHFNDLADRFAFVHRSDTDFVRQLRVFLPPVSSAAHG